MRTKRIIRAAVLAILVSLSLLSGTTIWSNSFAFALCTTSEGSCLDTGCASGGGVCGPQELPEIDRKRTAAAFVKCWCLF